MKSRAPVSRIGLEGALMVLSPLPLLLPFLGNEFRHPDLLHLIFSIVGVTACFLCALTLLRSPLPGKLLGSGAALSSYIAAFQLISTNPFAALSASIGLIFVATSLFDFEISTTGARSNYAECCLQRARWAALTVLFVIAFPLILDTSVHKLPAYVIAASSVIAQNVYFHWAITIKSRWNYILPLIGIPAIALSSWLSLLNHISYIALVVSLLSLITIPRYRESLDKEDHWWEVLLNHPARILFTTFFSLCAAGTLLLIIPAATKDGTISLVDAIFTSVSAVCVTGLIVLDTPQDFTLLGQFSILLLIQLGGLGIMSIVTVALHEIGRRLSLKQERLLTSMTDTNHKNLVRSLATILKFTFVAEGLGALSLTILFHASGDHILQALWRGTFTAVSAFCNAGFALQSDSLVAYQTNPFILHIVAALIVFGGMAPATSLIIPRWLMRKTVPIPARISLTTTVVLLLTGTLCILSFEWEGVLAGLSITDKIQNAWFQSVTLRTAGFNSVDIAHIASPTFLVMITFMFIGGSPGGTAGGVKTTTIGIVAMTFWASVTNRNEIITQNRRIHAGTIYRAVTIVVAGVAMWFMVVLMLEVTQQLSSRDLIFEATSAIGTVGLSIGATPLLDEIGKVIIIIAMFAGRIGPLTLFMLLSEEQAVSDSRHPVETISIT